MLNLWRKLSPSKLFLLLGLLLLQFTFNTFLQATLQEEIRSPDGTSPLIWLLALGQILLTVGGEALITLTAVTAILQQDYLSLKSWTRLGSVIQQLMIEILRAWGSILRGLLLFIVPGILRMLRFLFVPYVVLFNPNYWKGKRDALSESEKITQLLSTTDWWILMALKVAAPVGMGLLYDGKDHFWISPLATLSTLVLECFVVLLTIFWMSRTYKKLATKTAND